MEATLPSRSARARISDDAANIQPVLASWSRAVERFNTSLTADEKKKISLTDLSAPFSLLKDAATAAQTKVEKARYPWTPTLCRVIEQINRYATVGDVLVQHHAEYTSLAWGTIRFLLQFAAEEPKTAELVTKGLNAVTQVVFRAEEYAKLFQTASGSESDRVFESLQENLVCLYAEVLSFLVRGAVFYSKGTLRRVVSAGFSSDTKLKAILERVYDYERNVEKDKNLLESESRKKQEEFENGVWLQAADFEAELTKLLRIHKEGTRQWFFEREEYQRFESATKNTQNSDASTKDRFLCVSGKPGSGKSVLAAQVIQRLRQSGAMVAYALCKAGQEKKSTLSAIIRSLIFQLLRASRNKAQWHRLILATRQNKMTTDVTECTEELWAVLSQMLREEDDLIFVLDAIDECGGSLPESQELLGRLRQVFKAQSSSARLISISRVECSESESPEWNSITVMPSDLQTDIRSVIQDHFDKSKALSIHPERVKLLETIVTNSDGVLLWADLTARELVKGHWNPEEVFRKPPRGIYPLYDECMRRLMADDTAWSERKTVLKFILAAMRPLSLHELSLCMAYAKGLKRQEDYEQRGDPIGEAKAYVTECSPLLNILADNTVQLVHASFREYLLDSEATYGSTFAWQDVHTDMARILIKCFYSIDVSAPPSVSNELFRRFNDYAARNLVAHCLWSTDQDLPTQLVEFIKSNHGCNWLEHTPLEIDYEDILAWQAPLAEWSVERAKNTSKETEGILRKFLIILAGNRLACMSEGPEKLQALNHLAGIYMLDGNTSQAERLLLTSQEKWDDIPLYGLEAAVNLTEIYLHRDQYDDANKLGKEAWTKSEKLFGRNHYLTIKAMQTVAAALARSRRWKEAEETFEQVFEARKALFGPENGRDANLMTEFGVMYISQGRYSDAEKICLQSIENQRQMGRGDTNPIMVRSKFDLAKIYSAQKRWEEAESLLMETSKLSGQIRGPEHWRTLEAELDLAEVYLMQERYEPAAALAQQNVERSKRVLPKGHRNILRGFRVLVASLCGQQRHDEALCFAEEWYNLGHESKGATAGDQLNSMAHLAYIYWETGRKAEAISLLRDCIARGERELPDNVATLESHRRDLHGWETLMDAQSTKQDDVRKVGVGKGTMDKSNDKHAIHHEHSRDEQDQDDSVWDTASSSTASVVSDKAVT